MWYNQVEQDKEATMVRVSLPTICVVPDVEGKYKKMRVLRVLGIGIAVAGFLCSILCILLSVAADINSIPFMSIPMVFIFVGMMLFMLFNYKAMQYARVKAVVNTVKSRDKVLLMDIFSFESNALELAQAMIDTGNLSDYELVAGVLLAKKELHISEREAIAMHDERMRTSRALAPIMGIPPVTEGEEKTKLKQNFCTQCGAEVKDTDKFCPSCGTKLDK